MSNIKEKLMAFLLATTQDEELIVAGRIPELFQQNRDAAVRLLAMCGSFFCLVFLWLIMFSVSGFAFQLILLFAAFGILAGAVYKIGYKNVYAALKYPVVAYPAAFTFAFGALYLLSDVFSQGGFFAVFTIFLVIGALAGGIYKLRMQDAVPVSNISLAIASSLIIIFFSGLILSCISLSVTNQQERVEAWAEQKRIRQAQEMKQNMMSCTTEEECARLQMNKNKFYQEHEMVAQETCERAVAAQIPSRFEWTVTAKTPKFSQYSIDVLKETIMLSGDKATLIEADGSKKPFSYTCIYNTKTKTAKAKITQ